MIIALERATAPTPEIMALLDALNRALDVGYAPDQKHALSVDQLFQPNIRFFIAGVSREDLDALRELADAGKLRPVIDRTYPFEETAAAVDYAATQQAAGKVVVSVRTA